MTAPFDNGQIVKESDQIMVAIGAVIEPQFGQILVTIQSESNYDLTGIRQRFDGDVAEI